MKNDEETNYFSKIGKKLNIKYGNVYIEYKDKKKLLHNYYRQQLDNFLLDEEERSKNRNIFDNLLLKKRNKLMLEDEDSSSDSYNPDKKKKSINIYKYHQLHLEKIKRLKTSHFFDEKPRELVYEPNFDSIKKKVITGPKWNTMTGRKKEKKLILNNTFNICSKKLKSLKRKQQEELKKLKIVPLKKNYSAINITQNLQKIAKKLNFNHNHLIPKEKNKFCEKFEKSQEIKKTTPKTEKISMNLFPELDTSKTYLLNETDIKNRYLKNVFFINTSINKINKNKSLVTDTKIFRKKNQIGLNYEQLKIINAFKDSRKDIKEKIKKLKVKKILNKKYKLLLIDEKKENKKKIEINNNDKYGIRLIKKSFNYFINKSRLKKNNLNEDDSKNNNKSFIINHPLIKYREYYKYNADDINEYSFSKFDNITLKALNCN